MMLEETKILLLLYVVFFLNLCLCSCQLTEINTTTISSLRDPTTISSSRNVFQLGFYSPPNTTNRYLAIYYTVSPEDAIWIANREQPLNDSSGHLTVAPDGNLVLTNRWNETIWSTNINTTSLRNNTSAQLLNTGNLLLKHTSTGTILWESFSQPLNIFVSTMKLSYETNTQTNISLSSWKSPYDPALGNCTFGLEALTIPQIYNGRNGHMFWRSGPWNGHFFTGMEDEYSWFYRRPRDQAEPKLDQQGAGVPQLYKQNGTFYYAVPEGLFLLRTVLNSTCHSIFSLWNDQQRIWDVKWMGPADECEIYGICGPFGSCNRSDSPICSCLTGFEPSNPEEWNRGNWTGGCVRRRQLQCSLNNNTRGTEDRFLRIPYTKVPDFGAQVPSIQLDECMRRCLGNCSCIAYAHEQYMGCLLWSDNLIDVMMMDGVGIDLHIRLPASELDNPRDLSLVITIPVVGGFIVICISILIAWRWIVKRKESGSKAKDIRQAIPSKLITTVLKHETKKVNDIEELPLFTFETLENATDQFSDRNLLGTGGFGFVYKGILQDGKEVAVKRLSSASGQGNDEFTNEVVLISKLQHRNLVMLLGCCVEREEKMLVYEYMPNKSLDRYLFDAKHVSHKILDWKRRAGIIEGVGRGLLYLHNDSRLNIIHRDLKPSNVLLDEDWNPKISDFGLARIFSIGEEHDNTSRIVGTYGYMAPEYAMEGQYSVKSDIYSFGVVMLEILSGKKNTQYHNQVFSLSLLGWAWKMWHENNGLEFADQSIASRSIHGDIMRHIHIALLCVQEFPDDRPFIETVLSMLSNEIIDLPVPKEPAIFPENSQAGTSHSLSLLEYSVNEVTITAMDGR